MSATGPESSLSRAAMAFEATSSADRTPQGRRRRLQARIRLYEALVEDGWEPDPLCQRQHNLDGLALRRLSRPEPVSG